MRLAVMGILVGALAAAGCSSTPKNQPAWVTERLSQTGRTYPNLHDVPRTNDVNTNAQHWAAVQQDVQAAGQAMLADPRSQPAPADDPNAFISDAQNAIDQSRQAHGPN